MSENNYLGSFPINIKDTVYKDYTPSDLALLWIEMFGGIDGAHHKAWVLDQIARILNGGEIIIMQAKWEDGTAEYRFEVKPSTDYYRWVEKMKFGEDGPDTYNYEEGITP